MSKREPAKIETITGVVLAGGKSSRMGRNKALLPFHGKPLIETVIEIMTGIFPRVVVSVAPENELAFIPLPLIPDRYPEIGPAGGITSVLESAESRIFCVACDMPFLNPELIRFLCRFSDCDAVIPVWHGRVEVLHAFYSGSLLPSFQHNLSQFRYKITDSLNEAHVRYAGEDEIKILDPTGNSFRNVNTPSDFEAL